MSAILSADDLNDFISPGVACIKPVNTVPESAENGEVDIQIDANGNPLEISKIDGKINSLSPAQISLADCLACSGCITSAEEILVAQHSHDELIRAIREKVDNNSNRVFVASISHQARASLATAYNLSVEEIDRLLVNLFINQMGFTFIVGTSLGRKLSLIYESHNIISKKKSESAASLEGPLLSSICPGWVLYAEKTHPYILPRISETKSPQQITGCMLKTLTAAELGVDKRNVYHLSIMPCFDKKLESARPEHYETDKEPVPDVDCVLTPKELVTLLDQYSDTFQLLPPNGYESILASPVPTSSLYETCAPKNWPFVQMSWSNDAGSASGGYGYNYLKMYQNDLVLRNPSTYHHDNFSIVTISGRNTDLYELRLMYGFEKIASAAIVNGFKNIQNLVRKLKPNATSSTKKVNPLAGRRRARVSAKDGGSTNEDTADPSKCDYVEIMACPNGCINGGGQIAPPKETSEKDWLQRALLNYEAIPTFDVASTENIQLVAKFIEWCQSFCQEFDTSENRLLKTWFNEVEKPTDPNAILLGAKW